MFTSIISNSSDSITFTTAMICLAAALVLGLVFSAVYMHCSERFTKNFVVTLALLPAMVATVIFMTNGSLGSAVAVAGAFSLVRFRSVPGTSREILSIFFAMTIGLACGMGQLAFAAVFTVLLSGCFVLLMKFSYAGKGSGERSLRVTIPENLDYTEIFDDIFVKYTTGSRLERVRTVGLGSMYELSYMITMKNENDQKAMLDEIRARNGNLSVVYGRVAENAQEL